MPSPRYSFTALAAIPGLRMATMQRLTFHCAPISLTAVDMTASALVWRYSLRVISATLVKLFTSADSAGGCPGAGGDGTGAFAAVFEGGGGESGADAARCGFFPAARYNCCKSWLRSSSPGN